MNTNEQKQRLVLDFDEIEKRYEVTKEGKILSGEARTELTQSLDSDGYPQVRMYLNSHRWTIKVHRLVCTKYHGERPSPRHEVRHLDGNKQNNHCDNLAWGTSKQNALDRDIHGNTSRGISHSAAIKTRLPEKTASSNNPDPTPWEIKSGYKKPFSVWSSDGNLIVSLVHGGDLGQRIANAELIVKSVNSYEPMQQRIKELEEALKNVCDEARKCRNYAGMSPEDFSGSATFKAESLLQSSKQL